jgi:hypothetical protein
MIDVSAGYTVQNDGTKVSQGDAGLISLVAPNGGVAIDGIIEGAARGSGKGGSFILDTNNIGDITALNDRLTTKTDSQGNVISGGFTESLDLRASTGDIDIVSGQSLLAHDIKLTADGGNIDVNGNITAAAKGSSGGSVELYAMNNVNVNNGGSIRAVSTGTGSLDPNVLLSSNQGSVNVNGMIDVSGTNSTDSTGIVYLRAPRNKQNNDVNINIAGTITGDNAIYVEAFRTYDISNTNTISTPPAALTIWIADALNFSANNQAIATRLGTGSSPTLHLLPGIELDSYKNNTGSAGDITWNTAWNQGDANGIRFGGEPGVLTLRAAGDLNINGNLTDSPSGNYLTSAPPGRNSWGFNLVAGADSSSADYMAVNTKGTGNLRIADNVTVYTEGAPIRFASGGDTVIGAADQPSGFMMTSYMMNYNLASFTGSIHGNVGRDLSVAGAVQTATGDIDIKIGRDLNLLVGNDSSNLGAGAIRTTGQLSPGQESMAWGTNPLDPMVIDPVTGQSLPGVTQSDIYQTYYWRYDKGGNINLVVGRQAGKLNNSSQWVVADNKEAWDYFSPIEVSFSQAGNGGSTTLAYYGVFSADYENGTAGLATMGGGNLTVLTGGDFLAQAGTFGAGNLTIYSGGDIKGRFLNKDGQGVMHAMGNFGSYDKQAQIELLNSRQMNVTAEGEIQIGEVLNPTLASDKVDAYRDSYFVQCTYTPDTSISLKAGTDVTLAGNSPYYENKKVSNSTLAMENERVLPATVSIDAKDDIYLLNNFTLASSPTGNLSLDAAGDVIGQVVNSSNGTYQSATLLVSDVSPQNWYGLFYIAGNPNEQLGHWIAKRNSNLHGLYDPADNTWSYSEPLHTGDDQPVTIHADEDIKNLNLKFPKKAEVTAGRDIVDITYEGQNISPDDVSMIRAGMDISMRYFKASQTSTNNGEQIGLIQGGPGVFLVQAAGSIDLGSSLPDGIQEIGNGNDPAVWPDKSSLIILSGYSFGESNDDVSSLFKTGNDVGQFFSNIRNAGDEYAKLMADGKLDDAATLLQSTRNTYITPLLNTASGTGDINMTSSQISTSNAASDIFVIANGNLNLGKTALPNAGTVNTTTGITTANGGAINIFAVKDVNVQESRVMTFFSRQDMTDPSTAYGDITVWSDQGSINAGRGSRTAVSASPPKRKQVSGQPGVYMTVFTPPAVGSGIRAMTYGDNAPDPGNIHLFAPSGVIDAGEAGIAGGTVTLAALTVTNAANISFSAGSIGVPQQSAATTNLGTLTGSGSATQNSQLTSDVAGIDVARAQASQMIEDIIAKWLDVKVIDFVEDDNSGENK